MRTALFPQALWPRAIKCCAFLEVGRGGPSERSSLAPTTCCGAQVDGKKMSKSTGNFLTLYDAGLRNGRGCVRIAMR